MCDWLSAGKATNWDYHRGVAKFGYLNLRNFYVKKYPILAPTAPAKIPRKIFFVSYFR